MRTILIIFWSGALVYFIVRIAQAERLPELFASVAPGTFRAVYALFALAAATTIYYLWRRR